MPNNHTAFATCAVHSSTARASGLKKSFMRRLFDAWLKTYANYLDENGHVVIRDL